MYILDFYFISLSITFLVANMEFQSTCVKYVPIVYNNTCDCVIYYISFIDTDISEFISAGHSLRNRIF